MRGRPIQFLIVAILTFCAAASTASQKAAKPLLSERFNCGVRALGSGNPDGGLIILVNVAPNGGISWNRMPIDQNKLTANLESATSIDPQPAFIVEPDARTPYGRVAPIIWALQRVGIARVTCIVPVRTQ